MHFLIFHAYVIHACLIGTGFAHFLHGALYPAVCQ